MRQSAHLSLLPIYYPSCKALAASSAVSATVSSAVSVIFLRVGSSNTPVANALPPVNPAISAPKTAGKRAGLSHVGFCVVVDHRTSPVKAPTTKFRSSPRSICHCPPDLRDGQGSAMVPAWQALPTPPMAPPRNTAAHSGITYRYASLLVNLHMRAVLPQSPHPAPGPQNPSK